MALDLQGWDIAYALPFSEMNKAIAQKFGDETTSFERILDSDGNNSEKRDSCTAGAPCRVVKGAVARPRLTPGGGGSNVNLIVVMPKEGTFSYSPQAPEGRPATITLPELAISLQVKLAWVAEGKPFQQSLKVDPDTPVQILNVDYHDQELPSDKRLTSGEKLFFEGALSHFFNASPEYFKETFATALILEPAQGSENDFSWATPTAVGYAVIDDTNNYDLDKSIFGILGMTGGRDKPATAQLPGQCIPKGDPDAPNYEDYKAVNASFMVSLQQVLKQLLLPNMKLLFVDAATEDFEVSGNSLYNKKELTLHKTRLTDGDEVSPKVDIRDFSVTIQDQSLVNQLKISFENSPGVTVTISDTSHSRFFLFNKEGTQQIGAQFLFGQTNTEVDVATWVEIVAIGAEILAAIVAGLLTSFAEMGAEAYSAEKTTQNTATRQNLNVRSAGTSAPTPPGDPVTPRAPQSEVDRFAMDEGWDYEEPRRLYRNKRSGQTITYGEMSNRLFAWRQQRASTRTVGAGAGALANQGRSNSLTQVISQHKAKIASIVAFLITLGISELTIKLIEASLENEKMPDLDKLMGKLAQHVQWPGSTGYQLKTLDLDGALLFGLKAEFSNDSAKKQ